MCRSQSTPDLALKFLHSSSAGIACAHCMCTMHDDVLQPLQTESQGFGLKEAVLCRTCTRSG